MKKHMKRLSSPKTWPIQRKTTKFILRPNPGAHSFEDSMTLLTILTEVLKVAKDRREAEKILQQGQVIVDGIVRSEKKFSVGLMDTLTLAASGENYRILLDKKGKLYFKKITKEEAEIKPCKIIDKKVLKGNKIQLNLFDGRNLIVKDNKFKPGDTVLISKGEIKKHLSFSKGATVYFIGGTNIGEFGTVEEIIEFPGSLPSKIMIKSGKQKMEGLKGQLVVVEESIVK
ncbi:MAG: 30S ribosomal protein S4e [Candidatus Nanoarchaeia archaeon]|nr:30S ribosomal protein S4e [Candidatus Nanoarchaeia archaeon]